MQQNREVVWIFTLQRNSPVCYCVEICIILLNELSRRTVLDKDENY